MTPAPVHMCGDSRPGGNEITQNPQPTAKGSRVVDAYLYISKVDTVEVCEHLVDLGGVLQHGAGRLGQVVQGGVATQGLGKSTDSSQLTTNNAGQRQRSPESSTYTLCKLGKSAVLFIPWVQISCTFLFLF